MKRLAILLIASHTCLLLATDFAWSNGVVRDSMGATSSGRAGANIAHSDNGAILLNNPAGMINVTGNGLYEFGIDTVITDLDYTDPENSAANKIRPGVLPELSLIQKSDDDRWAAGIGVFAPAGFSATWTLTNPLLGSNAYKSFGALGKILPAAAYRVNDRLSVGGTFGVAISHLELESPFFLQTGALAGAPTLFDLQATGAAPAWSVGMQYQLGEWTTIGASFINETRFDYDGSVRASVFGLGPAPVESNFDAEVSLAWPRSAGIGIVHWLCCCQRVSADVIWYDWSHAFDSVDIKLKDASNPLFPALLGPVVKDSFPLKWNDSVAVKIGYERFLDNCDVIRLGYVYNSRNLPSSTLTPLIPATLEHTFTVGYGTHWNDWRCDFAYQYSLAPDRTVGTSALAGGDFSSSGVESQAHWITLSAIRQF